MKMTQVYTQYVEPRNHQVSHYQKVEKIVEEENFYIDCSPLGAGKTYPPLYLTQKKNLKLFVVAPLTVLEEIWKIKPKEYGIEPIECITYETLRGFKGRNLKHKWLIRNTVGDQTRFDPTPELEKLIEDGCCFVFEEAHKLKNRSAQFLACRTISHAILKSKSASFFTIISGTIFDKIENARQFLELTGIIKSHFMYRSRFGTIEYKGFGLDEVIQKAKKYNEQKAEKIISEFDLNDHRNIESTIDKLIHRLLTEIIQHHIGSVMSKNDKNKNLKESALVTLMKDEFLCPDLWNIVSNYLFREDKKNGYFNLLNQNAEKQLMIELGELARGIGYNGDAENVDLRRLGKMSKSLQNIETLKITIFNRVTRSMLTIYNKSKAVLFLNYTKNIKMLAEMLSEYNPVVLIGSTKNRSKLIQKFNNDPTCRVFIANTSIAEGIELDDKIGDAPRFGLQSPCYKMISMLQSSGRIFRENTKSSVWIRFVYVNFLEGERNLFKEKRILDAISKKSNVLKSIIGGESQLYPGDFEDEYESKEMLKSIF